MIDTSTLTPEQAFILDKENQHFIELQGISALDPYLSNNSASRIQMFTNNLGQWLVIEGSTERYQQTGAERDHANYTFSIKAPCNLTILSVINRYPPSVGDNGIRRNPETIIIYEDDDTMEIGMVPIVNFRSLHTTFGFKYVEGPAYAKIYEGSTIRKGEVFLQSTTISEHKGYKPGLELNVLHATLPGVAEDGIIIVEDVLERMKNRTIIKRSVEFGPNWIPLNLYGNDDVYRICPDVDEKIREDGLLFGLRPHSEDTSPYDHSIHGLQEYQEGYDRGLWLRHGGRVIDIKVIHDPQSRQPRCLEGVDGQLLKYCKATTSFNQRLTDEYFKLRGRRGKNLKLTRPLHNLFSRSLYFTNKGKGGARMPAEQQKARLDDWYVEFTIETEHVPDIGSKLTGMHGDKGVVVKKIKAHEAPIDDFGNRADIIVSAKSTINRSIIGRLFEPKFNAIYRDLCVRIRERHNLPDGIITKELLGVKLDDRNLEEAWKYLVGFKKIYSPHYVGPEYESITDRSTRLSELADILSGDRIMFMPPDNEPTPDKIAIELQKDYQNFESPITYIDAEGNKRRTIESFMIGSAYHLLLDKTGDDWAAVNSSRLQHYGVLAKITNNTKYTSLIRHQPSRIWGEAEVRILVSYTPVIATAELMDLSNNRETMEEAVWQLLTADNPSDIEVLIDRKKIPYGKARTTEIVNHVAETGGWAFKYSEYVPPWANTLAKATGTNIEERLK